MAESVSYRTSGGDELIKSGPGMLMGYTLTTGSPLGSNLSNCIIAYYDNIVGVGNSSANMLAHGQAIGKVTLSTITWKPSWPHVFGKGLWLEVISGFPTVTTSYF